MIEKCQQNAIIWFRKFHATLLPRNALFDLETIRDFDLICYHKWKKGEKNHKEQLIEETGYQVFESLNLQIDSAQVRCIITTENEPKVPHMERI